jgi:hypothetical protein
VREENDSGLQRWGRGEREQEWEGRRRDETTCVRNEREKEKGTGRNMAKTAGEMDERIRKRRERIENERSEGEQ